MFSTLIVQNREKKGTRESQKLRSNGFVPGIIYGARKEPIPVSVQEKGLTKECSSSMFFNRVLILNIGDQEEKVLPKEVVYHPVTGRILHIDFMRVAKGSKVKLQIPVEIINEDKSPGIKKGGIVNLVVHRLECMADPEFIPEKIELDLTGKEIGDSFLLDQIGLPTGIEPVNAERDSVLATIVVSKVGIEDTKMVTSTDTTNTTTDGTKSE